MAPPTFNIIDDTPGNFNTILVGTTGDDSISGLGGIDALLGLDGNDTLDGGTGSDLLDGGAGSDSLFGGDGDDTLQSNNLGGNDTFNGGDGIDTVDYRFLGEAVTLQVGGIISKTAGGNDRIANIERIRGALGMSNRNAIDGTDSASGVAFNIDLAAESLKVVGIPGSTGPLTLSFDVQYFVDVTGTNGNDTITGSDTANVFFGSTGDDTYNGGSDGFDTLDYSNLGAGITLASGGKITKGSGKGTDTFTFGPGPTLVQTIDEIIGATGFNNAIVGTLLTPGANGAKLNVDLTAETLEVVFEDSLSFGGISIVPGDTLNFTVKTFNQVTGGNNDDSIKGSAGNDTFFGSNGNDTYDGGAGTNNVLDYGTSTQAITLKKGGVIDKGLNGTDQITGTTQTIQTIIGATGQINAIDGTGSEPGVAFNIDLGSENLGVVGLRFGTAQFTVKNFVNVTGTSGSDTITGSAADNTFFGSEGDDTYNGGSAGNDTLDYSGLGAGITLSSGGKVVKGGSKGTDTFTFAPGTTLEQTIETIVGATGFDNAIVGTLLTPGANGAKLNVDLTAETLQVVFEDTIPIPGGPTIVPGDTLNFTVKTFNQVTGGNNNDSIKGGDGNDTFFGSKGNDTLDGAAGANNVLDYSALDDVITLKVGGFIDKGANGIDQITRTGQTIKTIVGATGETNVIDGTGSIGDVRFSVNLNNNLLRVVNLPTTGQVTEFTVSQFVNVIGTGASDTLVGNSQANIFNGANGNDNLNASGGDDVVLGGNGNDNLNGGTGNDSLEGEAGNDVVLGGDGIDTLNGGAGNDSLDGGTNNDSISGGDGSDTLIGGNGNDSLLGGNGTDLINGVGSNNGSTDLDILTSGNTTDSDIFVLGNAMTKFYIGTGQATVTDFTSTLDKIQLNGVFSDYNTAVVSGNTQIRFGSDVIATLNGVTSLNFGDFIFVGGMT